MKPAPTILEISKILKMSASTVSRALKNHPNIAPATRQKVLDLAAKLDYEPNLNAVGLRTLNSKEIAIIVPAISGFFYDSFVTAVEEETRKTGYSLIILVSGDSPEVELENLKICKQRRVEGIMVCLTLSTTSVEEFIRIQKLDVPVVFFDKIPPDPDQNTVRVADEKAATLAAQALVQRNRKKVLSLFGDPHLSISYRRAAAYTKVFDKTGVTTRMDLRHVGSSDQAEQVVSEVFSASDRPDAIFCMSDEILTGVMKAVQRLKINYPEPVAIITISNGFFPRLYYH